MGIKTLNGAAADISGKKVVAFCGLGNPESFRKSLAACSCEIAAFMTFRDHHIYDEGDIFQINKRICNEKASGAVTTLKDLVKVEHLWPKDSPLYFLEISIEIESEFFKLLEL